MTLRRGPKITHQTARTSTGSLVQRGQGRAQLPILSPAGSSSPVTLTTRSSWEAIFSVHDNSRRRDSPSILFVPSRITSLSHANHLLTLCVCPGISLPRIIASRPRSKIFLSTPGPGKNPILLSPEIHHCYLSRSHQYHHNRTHQCHH